VHVKDCAHPTAAVIGEYVDEESLHHYVAVSPGSGVYDGVLRDLRGDLPRFNAELQAAGVPGFILDLEPHLQGGGQFGGFSGAAGMEIALRALCRLLDELGMGYHLGPAATPGEETGR
jgi:hypothetical protein